MSRFVEFEYERQGGGLTFYFTADALKLHKSSRVYVGLEVIVVFRVCDGQKISCDVEFVFN